MDSLHTAIVMFICGIFIGTAVGFVLGVKGAYTENFPTIAECEKDLPRSERCVMVAVPETEVQR